jgi:uncharacterized protein
MNTETVASLGEIEAPQWNAMVDADYPFLRHEFLHGLELHSCLAEQGWVTNHVIAHEGGRLIGAMPLYLRDNSWGEFVFDHTWAQAYERAGGRYYPKLVCAIPFTPVTGPRLLFAADRDPGPVASALLRHAVELMRQRGLSSLHCLFPPPAQLEWMRAEGGLRRGGCQYHWHNQGYRDFQDFLDALDSKHRKQLRRERRDVSDAGVEIEVLNGAAISDEQWQVFHQFYCDTFARKWGEPRLTTAFFRSLSRTLPDATLLFLARRGSTYVGGAFAMQGSRTLYGRHWGCSDFVRHLHFDLCYYQTIDYCIRHRLQRLDAGAQGEHKLARGFTAVPTWSMHWLRERGFASAVSDFVSREQSMIDSYIVETHNHSPYANKAKPA